MSERMTPKQLVQELMVRDEPAFHNARVCNFFEALDRAGYAIVPKEPTDAMIEAGAAGSITFGTLVSLVGDRLPYWHALAKYHYLTMLRAVHEQRAATKEG